MSKKILCSLLILFLCIISLTLPAKAGNDPDAVQIGDDATEQIIRSNLQKPTGPIRIADLMSITTFVADANAQVSDVSILAYCINLRIIDVSDQMQLDSIEPLRGLPSLAEVYIRDCPKLVDLAPLQECGTIQSLSLSAPLSDLSFVQSLPQLKMLNITASEVTDIWPLAQISGLESFYGSDCPIKDFSPLLNHRNMRSISLSHVSKGFFRQMVDSWDNLTSVRLLQSEINGDDLALLNKYPLESLELSFSPLGNIDALQSQRELLRLEISHCGIRDISPLQQLRSLTGVLDLRGNPIEDLTPLRSWIDLESLYLSESTEYAISELKPFLPNTEILVGDMGIPLE